LNWFHYFNNSAENVKKISATIFIEIIPKIENIGYTNKKKPGPHDFVNKEKKQSHDAGY
jgi:hypothetical protein